MSGSDNPLPLFHFAHCSHPQTERKRVDVSIVCKREFWYLGGVALYFFSWRSEVFIAALIHQLPTHCVVLVYQQRKWICCSISPRWFSMPPMCPYYWTVGGVQLSKSAFTAVSQWPLSRPLDKGTVFSTLSSLIKEFPQMNTCLCVTMMIKSKILRKSSMFWEIGLLTFCVRGTWKDCWHFHNCFQSWTWHSYAGLT